MVTAAKFPFIWGGNHCTGRTRLLRHPGWTPGLMASGLKSVIFPFYRKLRVRVRSLLPWRWGQDGSCSTAVCTRNFCRWMIHLMPQMDQASLCWPWWWRSLPVCVCVCVCVCVFTCTEEAGLPPVCFPYPPPPQRGHCSGFMPVLWANSKIRHNVNESVVDSLK